MKSKAKCYEEMRAYVETVPLIDCHDHSEIQRPRYDDPIAVIVNDYTAIDLESVTSAQEVQVLRDGSKSIEERWPVLEKAWKRCCHTGLAQVTQRVLKRFYDVEELTLETLKQMQPKLLNLEDEKVFESIITEANIAAQLENVDLDFGQVLDGTAKLRPRTRLVPWLRNYKQITNYQQVQDIAAKLGEVVTFLDEYLDVCWRIFEAFKKFGAVALKDYCAYFRPLEFGNPTRAQAEEVFNLFMQDPRRIIGWPDENKPLDDFLFHEFMRMARDLDLPVQIHTGYFGNGRNDLSKGNVTGMTSIFELHSDVRFSLLHGNWPWPGEAFFLAKNFSNVVVDFSWANALSCIATQQMIKDALGCVPHGKIHGYGSDYLGQADCVWASASLARDNMAMALADLVEIEYLSLADAKQVAYDLFFANPNEFYRLGL